MNSHVCTVAQLHSCGCGCGTAPGARTAARQKAWVRWVRQLYGVFSWLTQAQMHANSSLAGRSQPRSLCMTCSDHVYSTCYDLYICDDQPEAVTCLLRFTNVHNPHPASHKMGKTTPNERNQGEFGSKNTTLSSLRELDVKA